jgi:hypothetical protein
MGVAVDHAADGKRSEDARSPFQLGQSDGTRRRRGHEAVAERMCSDKMVRG